MQKIESSFEKLLVLLVEHDVAFVTVGGIAVCLHGYVRLTEDVDILVDPSQQNVAKLITALQNYGEGYGGMLTQDDFDDQEGALRVIEAIEHCQIDIFTRMQGLHLEDFADDIQSFLSSSGVDIPYLGSSSLIRLKSQSLREKDRVDVSVLKRIQNGENF
ncbi:MAG: hypothetical protein ACPG6P_03620 [Akkermansiaceae bacterium]